MLPYSNLKSSDSDSDTMINHKEDQYCHTEKSALYPGRYHKKMSSSISIRLYKRRYIMLFLFILCSMMNGVPQYQYTVVADIIMCYYGVSLNVVNWASVVYMVAFLPLVFPVMYLMDTRGLRVTLIIGGILNLLGSLVQCFTFDPNNFIFVLVCQTIYAFGQVFILSLPPFIAGVWFGAAEVGLACALGVFGNQLGIAIGFIIPPILLTNDCQDKESLEYQFSVLAFPQLAINITVLILIIFVFEEKPKTFPSIAQATKQVEERNYIASLKRIFKNGPFVLLLLAYGFISGSYFSISTILNEMVLIHFPGEEVAAGWMGAIMVFTGMAGSVFLGVLFDRTHKYKQISLLVFSLSFALMTGYTVLIFFERLWIQYVFFAFLGFFMTGYIPAGFDFGAEITYPESEAMSGSLLNTSTQIFSILFTNVASWLLQSFGDFYSDILFCACLLLGTLIIASMKCQLKRSSAAIDAVKP